MAEPVYAVIAYVPGSLGRFVNEQRDRFDPEFSAVLAHVTVLPQRPLTGSPEQKLAFLRRECAAIEPFDVAVDAPGTFWPAKGVVYLSLSKGGGKLTQLHQRLNAGELEFAEPFPFVPHLTIAQELDADKNRTVLAAVAQEWEAYGGERSFRIETLCLVKRGEGRSWTNLALIPLSSFFHKAADSTGQLDVSF